MSDRKAIINLDLGDLSKPATVLVEKVANAVGVWWEPKRIVRKAKAQSQAKMIEVFTEMQLSELEQRAAKRLIQQETKKQANIESIIAQAVRQLPKDAKPEALEEDWLVHFFEECANISDKDMQSIWARLLASEAAIPGAYSKRTVNIVAAMDRKDAELFTRFCQFTWIVQEPIPFIYIVEDDIYKDAGIDRGSLDHLNSIGLISPVSTHLQGVRNIEKRWVIYYFGEPLKIELKDEKGSQLLIGHATFTQSGKELFGICGAEKSENFYNYVTEMLSSMVYVSSVEPTTRADR